MPRFVPAVPSAADVPKPASIRFVTTDDFPPFDFLDGAGRLTGYNVELARAICARLSVPCTIQVRPFPLLLDAVVTNKADAIVAGVADTPRLREKLAYTVPYLRLPARFVTRRDADFDAVPEALRGRTVAVEAGRRTAGFLDDFFPDTTRRTVATADEALQAVRDGTADAAFTGALPAAFWLAGPAAAGCCRFAGGAWTEPAYFGQGLTIAVARENDALRRVLDEQLQALQADGVLADLYLRFFPVGLY